MLTERECFISIVDNDLICKSDAIILLEGDGLNRYQHAIQLFKQGWAPLLVFSGGIINREYGSFPYEEIEPLLLKEGISEKCLLHEAISQHTRQQAEEILKLGVKNGWKSIILVASPYHQYRAYLTFIKVMFEMNRMVLIYNSPAKNLTWFTPNLWGDRFTCLQREFDRIEKYSELGHVTTYNEAIMYQKWKEKRSIN